MANKFNPFSKNPVEEINEVGAKATLNAAKNARARGKSTTDRVQAAYDAYWAALGMHPMDQFFDPYVGIMWDPTIDPNTGIQTLGPTDSRDRYGNVPSTPTTTYRSAIDQPIGDLLGLKNTTSKYQHDVPATSLNSSKSVHSNEAGNGNAYSAADLASMTFEDAISTMTTDQFEDEWAAPFSGTPSSNTTGGAANSGAQHTNAAPAINSTPDVGAAFRTDQPGSPTYGKAPGATSFVPGAANTSSVTSSTQSPDNQTVDDAIYADEIYGVWDMDTPDDMQGVNQDDLTDAISFGWHDSFGAGIGEGPENGKQNGNFGGGALGGFATGDADGFDDDVAGAAAGSTYADDSGSVYSSDNNQTSTNTSSTGGGDTGGSSAAYSGDAAQGTTSSGMFSDGTPDGAYGGGAHGYGYGSKSDGTWGSLTGAEAEAAYGGGGDGGGGGSVICSELYRRHMISDAMYEADNAYGRSLDPDIITGYHLCAKPLVRLMRRSYAATIIIKFLALPWIQEIAYRQAGLKPGSVLGMFMVFGGLPLCKSIGRIKRAIKSQTILPI